MTGAKVLEPTTAKPSRSYNIRYIDIFYIIQLLLKIKLKARTLSKLFKNSAGVLALNTPPILPSYFPQN